MRYFQGPLLIAAICLLVLPVAAHGQAGQRPDPDSPAGVEYKLPLEEARKTGGDGGDGRGSDGKGGRPTRSSPLFGAGIVSAAVSDGAAGAEDESSSRDGGGAGAGSGTSGGGEAGDDGRRNRSAGARAVSQAALPSADDDGGSAALRVAGIALAVLILGGLLGLLLRRGLGQHGS